MEISYRDTASFIAGLATWNGLKLDKFSPLAIDRPLDIWVDMKRAIDSAIDTYIVTPDIVAPMLTSYFCGAIARRRFGDKDIHWDNTLQRLETSRSLFPLSAEAQKFCRGLTLTRIRLLANTLAIDKVVPERQLEWILGVNKVAA
jgi:hypothetical protein